MKTRRQVTGSESRTGSEWQQVNSQRRVYIMPDFCKISLPLQDPGSDTAEWVRVNGNRTYTIHPLTTIDDQGVTRHQWAYGKIARLLIVWISTQVVRRKRQGDDSRIVPMPNTLNDLMNELGIRRRPTGADYQHFREQIAAIGSFHMTVVDNTPDHLDGTSFTMANEWHLGWDKATPDTGTTLHDRSYIKLTDETWKRMERSVPLDAELVEILTCRGKGQNLDIYAWLTQRIYRLNHSPAFETPVISWESLSLQLGANYARKDHFVETIKKSLEYLHLFWPFRYKVVRGGIILTRSPMSVKPVTKPTNGYHTSKPRRTTEEHTRTTDGREEDTIPSSGRTDSPATQQPAAYDGDVRIAVSART